MIGNVGTMEIVGTSVAAEIVGVPAGTLRYWRYLDQGPKSFRVGKHVKYRRDDLYEWLNLQSASTSRGGV